MEYISEENYGLNFNKKEKDENFIKNYLLKIKNNELKFIPENIKNEVQEYINQELYVKFILNNKEK